MYTRKTATEVENIIARFSIILLDIDDDRYLSLEKTKKDFLTKEFNPMPLE